MIKFQDNIAILIFIVLLSLLAGCGTITRGSYYKDKNYNFDKSNRNILISLLNHDTYEAKGNKILENELIVIIKETLTSHGYSVLTDRGIDFRKGEDIHKYYKKIITEKNIHYHFVVTIEPTELRGERVPVSSQTRMETHYDVYSQSLKQTPVTHVSGGGSYSYHIFIITGSLFDTNTNEQVWFGRTRTKGFRYAEIKNFYLDPAKKLINKLIIDINHK